MIKFRIAEVHLTYACDLLCVGCNRACFVKPPHTPPMTLDRYGEFLDELRTGDIHVRKIRLLGGEPTLHPQFLKFVDMTVEYARSIARACSIRVVSNQFSQHSRELFLEARAIHGNLVRRSANIKPLGRVDFGEKKFMFISPEDAGVKRMGGCDWESSRTTCGFGVDQLGNTLCPMGGTVDSLLRLNARATSVKQLLDTEFHRWQSSVLCKHCGGCMEFSPLPRTWKHNGTPVSKTWHEAILSHQNKAKS